MKIKELPAQTSPLKGNIKKKKKKNAVESIMKAVEKSGVALNDLVTNTSSGIESKVSSRKKKKNKKKKKANRINGEKGEEDSQVGEVKKMEATPTVMKEGEEKLSKSAKKKKRKKTMSETADDDVNGSAVKKMDVTQVVMKEGEVGLSKSAKKRQKKKAKRLALGNCDVEMSTGVSPTSAKKKKKNKSKTADNCEERMDDEVSPSALMEGEDGMSKPAKKRKRKKGKNATTDDCEEGMDDEEPKVKKMKVVGEPVKGANEEKVTKKKKKKGAEAVLAKDEVNKENVESRKSIDEADDTMESPKKKKLKKKAANGNLSEKKKEKKKKIKIDVMAKFNTAYSDQPNKAEFTKCWDKSVSLQKDNGFELLNEPFKCAYMPKFFHDAGFLQNVKTELAHLDYHAKNNDLYKFHQTSDLKSVSSSHIASLREFLYGDFRKYLSEVTNIELNDTIDMSSSKYEYTDVLLCHDDELEGRRLAYILYLTPPWYEKDGGTLDLFSVDSDGQPKDVVKSLQPTWNTFTFFEVSPVSFHQVREVLAKDKVRLSINGWFHGPNIERPPKHIVSPRSFSSPLHLEEEEFYSWINPSYLDASTQKDIRKKFQNDSEIELESFLCDEKYEELSQVMQNPKLKWKNTGPANKQSCQVLQEHKVPETIKAFTKFLKSEALFLVLSQLTGLKLHHLAPPDSDPDSDEEENKDSSPSMTLDIRKWSHGCYTLLRDSDQEGKSSTLDATLFVNVADSWTLEHGASTSYIAKDEDEELLTVVPRSNCFAMVYRDIETLKFTKYINASVKDMKSQESSVFYDFSCTYKE